MKRTVAIKLMLPSGATVVGGEIGRKRFEREAEVTGRLDQKPDNVMIERAGTATESVKLVDFGIGKLKPQFNEQVEKLTQDGAIFGTCH